MKKAEREALQREKLVRMRGIDDQFRQEGLGLAGMDEVGRGPLAGPVVTACVVLPAEWDIPGIDDSKKLTGKRRQYFDQIIREKALAYGFGERSPEVIDQINILNATKEAMRDAAANADKMLKEKCGYGIGTVLIDAVHLNDFPYNQRGIVKGDQTSLSIAAASIIAKVRRDSMMEEYAAVYPQYDFEHNKGYGTKKHYEGLRACGMTPIHRRSFLKGL